MLEFHLITLEDKDWITAYYQKRDCPAAQYTFAASYIWSGAGYQVDVCEDEGYFFLRYRGGKNGYPAYRCPLGFGGPDGLKNAVEKLKAFCREQGEPLLLHNVPEEERAMLLSLYGDALRVEESRDEYEYLYEREKLATLAGKKYHGKRGHIKRFLETDWRYEPLTPALLPDVLLMHSEWCKLNDCGRDPELCREGKAVRKSLQNFEYLGLKGGLLYQDNRIVAYTIGEPTGGGAFAVHFEKAYSDVNGAYPTVNQLFVQRETEGFSLINREEDTGSEGLRKAKLSYHPVRLLELCNIEIPL